MKLVDFATWQADLLAYWDGVIEVTLTDVADQPWTPEFEPAGTIQQLKQSLRSQIEPLENLKNAYRTDSTRKGPWIDTLFSQMFYVQVAKVAKSAAVPVPIPAAIPGDDMRQLFAWWTQPLPDYEFFFTPTYNGSAYMPEYNPLAEPPVIALDGAFALEPTAAFTGAMALFSGLVADDIARMEAFADQVRSVTRERVAYGVFAGQDADIKAADVDAKTAMLRDMKSQQVLDEFNWKIKGLNA